jgi:hypothetical protein
MGVAEGDVGATKGAFVAEKVEDDGVCGVDVEGVGGGMDKGGGGALIVGEFAAEVVIPRSAFGALGTRRGSSVLETTGTMGFDAGPVAGMGGPTNVRQR